MQYTKLEQKIFDTIKNISQDAERIEYAIGESRVCKATKAESMYMLLESYKNEINELKVALIEHM
jgi:hypothetical protein